MSMPINEQIEALSRCRDEIKSLRREIEHLRPRSDAYQLLEQVLGLMPRRAEGSREDMVYTLDKRIRELQASKEAMKALNIEEDRENYENATGRKK